MSHIPQVLVRGDAASVRLIAEHLERSGQVAVQTPEAVEPVAKGDERPRQDGSGAFLVRRRPDVVVLADGPQADLTAACREAKREFGPYTPVLVVTTPERRALGRECLAESADGLQVGLIDLDELDARVTALVRDRRRHDALQNECARLERERRHIELVHRRINEELALAQKLQRSFLPRQLPEIGAVRFAARLLAVGPVAGDIYDVTRLDEHTVGFYVADAVGHGVAAALLTAFVKKAVRPKIINGRRYRILPPGDVLDHLNHEMLSAQLEESSFVTMAYGTIDVRTRVLSYSLAGHPPGICARADGRQEYLDEGGPLLGVMESEYRTERLQLEPGDKVVLYSDGIDTAGGRSGEAGPRALWLGVQRHADRPVAQLLECTLRDLLPSPHEQPLRDDLTVVGVEVVRPAARKEA
jgi:serine phosphatase RsbU (regulator of sigma subunit)